MHRQSCTHDNILGTDIEMVTSYKYLGVHLNNKLDWTDHTAATSFYLFLQLCGGISHFLWSSLLVQQHLGSRQEET